MVSRVCPGNTTVYQRAVPYYRPRGAVGVTNAAHTAPSGAAFGQGQGAYPHQIVDRGRERKHPPDPRGPAMSEFA